MKIGLLDSKWVEERDKQITAKASEDVVFAPGGSIESNLKQLAERRSDIFGVGEGAHDETYIGLKVGEEEQKVNEKNTWDGHSSSAEAAARAARKDVSLRDQIDQIHKQKGLIPDKERETRTVSVKPPPPQQHQPPALRPPCWYPSPCSFLKEVHRAAHQVPRNKCFCNNNNVLEVFLEVDLLARGWVVLACRQYHRWAVVAAAARNRQINVKRRRIILFQRIGLLDRILAVSALRCLCPESRISQNGS